VDTQPECWLRGPVEGIDPALMPAAQAFLQTVEDVERAIADLSTDEVWRSLGGTASIGFHLVHLCGSTDRLLTYARGERLNDQQKAALKAESAVGTTAAPALVGDVKDAISRALAQLRATPPGTLQDARAVGRAALPTTVLGLLFHAAEHSQRHAGQVVTTARILKGMR
jgi:uncharacterized damage-inducible protein DinB